MTPAALAATARRASSAAASECVRCPVVREHTATREPPRCRVGVAEVVARATSAIPPTTPARTTVSVRETVLAPASLLGAGLACHAPGSHETGAPQVQDLPLHQQPAGRQRTLDHPGHAATAPAISAMAIGFKPRGKRKGQLMRFRTILANPGRPRRLAGNVRVRNGATPVSAALALVLHTSERFPRTCQASSA